MVSMFPLFAHAITYYLYDDSRIIGVDDPQFTGYVRLSTDTAPSTPTAGYGALYLKSDKKLYLKDSDGTETDLTAGGSTAAGGSDTQLQYNNSGTIGGITGFVYDGSSVTISIQLIADQIKWGDGTIQVSSPSVSGSGGWIGTATSNLNMGSYIIYGVNEVTSSSFTIGANSLNTSEFAYLDGIDQSVATGDAVTFASVDTGQGANELYDMDQNVLTTSSPTFSNLNMYGDNSIWDNDSGYQTQSYWIGTATSNLNMGGYDISAANEVTGSSFTIGANSLETAEFGYLDGIDQSVATSDAVTFATVDTGQGTNELYDMDQNVLTTSSPTFSNSNMYGDISVWTNDSGYITSAGSSYWIGTATSNLNMASYIIYGANEVTASSFTIGANSLETAEFAYLDGIDQSVATSDAVTFASVDTGEGANELFDMDQNVLTTSSPTFSNLNMYGDISVWTNDSGYDTQSYWIGTATSNLNMGSYIIYGANEVTSSSFTIGANTLETAEFGYLDGINQSVGTGDAVTFTTINTGQGANELYDMDQNVLTTSSPTLSNLNMYGDISVWTNDSGYLTGASDYLSSTSSDTMSGDLATGANFLTVHNTVAEVTGDTYLLDLKYTDNNDSNAKYIICSDDSGGTPEVNFEVDQNGNITATGDYKGDAYIVDSANSNAEFGWTSTGNDHAYIAVETNGAAQSGNLHILEMDFKQNDYVFSITPDPKVVIFSGVGAVTSTDQYIALYHNRTAAKIDVGKGSDLNINTNIVSTGSLAGVTLDTGQGANELYDMDQNVLEASTPLFSSMTVTNGINVKGQVKSNSRNVIDAYNYSVTISTPFALKTTIGYCISPFRSFAVTVTSITVHVTGGTNVVCNIEERPLTAPDADGTEVLSGDITATTAGWIGGTIADGAIPADSALYLDMTSVSGDIDAMTIKYTITKD